MESLRATVIVGIVLACEGYGGSPLNTCRDAVARDSVCEAANAFAIAQMRTRHVVAISVVQNVPTGALVVFAASQPQILDVSSAVQPLSLSKLFLAASWWDHGVADPHVAGGDGAAGAQLKTTDVYEMLVNGRDAAGRQVALALRNSVGTGAVASDFKRYGFNGGGKQFWAEMDPKWSERLAPQPAYATVSGVNDKDWSTMLSIGEIHISTTALHVSRFLQVVGNDGLLCTPIARAMLPNTEEPATAVCRSAVRVLRQSTARQLDAAMLEVVQRGTAKGIKDALSATGWTIGGKTGTGGVEGAPMSKQNGWFAGLIFDPRQVARFTVATFVREGGPGGGNAAEISAELARFLIDGSSPNPL